MVIFGLVMIVMGFCILLLTPEKKKDWSVPTFFVLLIGGIAILYLGAINQGLPSAWELKKSIVYENMTKKNPPSVRDWKGEEKFAILVKKSASSQAEVHYLDQIPPSGYFTINSDGEMVSVNVKDDNKLPVVS